MTTTPTTRGYFGSAFFSNGYFGSDYWKERVQVPAPVPVMSVGGGSGGGFISGTPLAPLIPCEMGTNIPWLKIRCRPELMSSFAKAIAKKIQGEIAREAERNTPANPLSIPKSSPPEKVRNRDLRVLREKIRQLEAASVQMQASKSNEIETLRATIEALKRLVSGLSGRVELLGLKRLPVKYRPGLGARVSPKVEEIESDVNVAEVLSGKTIGDAISDQIQKASLLVSGEPVRPSVTLRKDPLTAIWKMVGAVGLYLAVEKIENPRWLRTTGFGAAITLGVAGLADLMGVEKPESAS